jgi:hypothetical protein
MRSRRRFAAALLVSLLAAVVGPAAGTDAPPPAAASSALVLCAPGYPGSTEEAQPAMDALAAAVAAAAGWNAGELKAVYFETERAGLDRIASADTALVLAPLPFWLQHRAALKLEPVMQAIEAGGQAAEPWTLVAAAGQVGSAAGLAGFELISTAGYAPRFVRGPALSAWGDVPRDVTITFSTAVLSGLRRASAGAKVAMLLDRAQAAALPALPFAAKLQVVVRSEPLPVSVLAAIPGRLPPARLKALTGALATLGARPAGAAALAGVRLSGFVPADQAALARARGAFDRSTP